MVVGFLFSVIIKTCPMLFPFYSVSLGLFKAFFLLSLSLFHLTGENGAKKTAREGESAASLSCPGGALGHILALGAVQISHGKRMLLPGNSVLHKFFQMCFPLLPTNSAGI